MLKKYLSPSFFLVILLPLLLPTLGIAPQEIYILTYPTEGFFPRSYIQLRIAVGPIDVDPYTATVTITDYDPFEIHGEGGLFPKHELIYLYFETPGEKEIHVHAWNDYGSVTNTRTITIEPYKVFIPMAGNQ